MAESHSSKKMRILIHNYFVEVDGALGPAKAQCVTCGAAIVCASGNTSSCRKHLQTKHPAQYSELLGKEDAKKFKVRILTNTRHHPSSVRFEESQHHVRQFTIMVIE
jgi:hypothetical protein